MDSEQLSALVSKSNADVNIGKLDDKDFLIFNSWADLQAFQHELEHNYNIKDADDMTIINRTIGENWGFANQFLKCDDCGNVVDRRHGGLIDYFIDNDSKCHCIDCVKNNPDSYIEFITNNANVGNTILTNDELMSYGFNEFTDEDSNESSRPIDMLSKIIKTQPESDIIFNISDDGKTYSVWVRSKQINEDFDDFDTQIQSDELYYPEMEEDKHSDEYSYVKSKSIEDSDGFSTDYTWYKRNSDGLNVFVYGDNDIYLPEDEDFDFETESDAVAKDWFNHYGENND